MRWVPWQKSKSLEFYAPGVPDDAGTFIVYSPDGGVLQTSDAPTLDGTSTQVNATAPAGSQTLTLVSTASVVAGRKYIVGGSSEATGGEWVLVSRVTSGTVVALVNPIRKARSVGDTFASSRVTFSIDSTSTQVTGRGFRIEWEWSVDSTDMDPVSIPFDVVRYSPVSAINLATLRALDANIVKRIPEGTWFPSVFETTWDMVLNRVAAKLPPGSVVGTIDLTIPHAYLALVVIREPFAGDDTIAAEITRFEARFTQELDAVMSNLPTDSNQDGDTTTREPGWSTRTIRLVRG